MTDQGEQNATERNWSGPDEELTREIIGAAIHVHRELGTGFVESIYRNALVIALNQRRLNLESEKVVNVYFLGQLVGVQRLDLLIESRVIVELKAVESLGGVHYAQLRSYLRATRLRSGLLINFTGTKVDYRNVSWEP